MLSVEHCCISNSSCVSGICLCRTPDFHMKSQNSTISSPSSRDCNSVCEELSAHRVLHTGGPGLGVSFHVAHDAWMYVSSEVTCLKTCFRADCKQVPAQAAQNWFPVRREGHGLSDWDLHTLRRKPSWKTAARGVWIDRSRRAECAAEVRTVFCCLWQGEMVGTEINWFQLPKINKWGDRGGYRLLAACV